MLAIFAVDEKFLDASEQILDENVGILTVYTMHRFLETWRSFLHFLLRS